MNRPAPDAGAARPSEDAAAYRAYLFDLDGTLVDTAPDLMTALNHALAAAGIAPVDEALTRHWVGQGVRAMLGAALEHRGSPAEGDGLEALAAILIEHYTAHVADRSRPYPGVIGTLEALARRASLAVVTNKPERQTLALLDALDLARHFGAVIAHETAARPKPAADPALLACERLGADAGEALFVGDSATDVACARAAGCPVFVVRHGYNHGIPADALGADRVIDRLDELLQAAFRQPRAPR